MNEVPPQVTVVIPTRNRWRLLRTSLWTALGQGGVAVRVVVVDDNSTDETRDFLPLARDDRLEIIRMPQRVGVSAARNAGLERVETEWVSFLDDDDVWAPFHLASVLEAVAVERREGKEIDLAYSGSVEITGERKPTQAKLPPLPADVPGKLLYENVLATPSRVVLRTDAVRDVGGFDTALSIAADWDLWLRIVRVGRLAGSSALSVGYTHHAGNMHRAVSLALRDLSQLEQRHARVGNGTQKTFTESCARWIAMCYRAAGRRGRAALWYLRSYRYHGEKRDIGRAIGVVLGEGAIKRSGLQCRREIPPDVAPWLEAVRETDRLPPETLPFGR